LFNFCFPVFSRRCAVEIAACRPWLEAEIAMLRPKVIVCLGATAAQALFGQDFRVT
jgi:DNA polymerase